MDGPPPLRLHGPSASPRNREWWRGLSRRKIGPLGGRTTLSPLGDVFPPALGAPLPVRRRTDPARTPADGRGTLAWASLKVASDAWDLEMITMAQVSSLKAASRVGHWHGVAPGWGETCISCSI
jgi:hypothetical protein